MCGRFTLTIDPNTLEEMLEDTFEDLVYTQPLPKAAYNIAPSENLSVIIYDNANQTYRFGYLKWGFEPEFSKTKKAYQIINARLESIDQKPFFKEAFTKRRCLILADGFYEWQKTPQGKQPMYVKSKKHKLMAFAGIYTLSKKTQSSGAIITAEATAHFERIHDRMPLMIGREDFKTWLLCETDKDLKDWAKHRRIETIDYYPVSKAVNNPKNKESTLIEPIDEKNRPLL